MRNRGMASGFVCAVSLLAADVLAEGIVVKSGETIAFMGDSITAAGAGSPAGYVRLVINGLEANGVQATAIPAGVSGHKSNQMLERLDRDVLSKKPDWMTLSCGVNDVWHGEKGVPLDQYKENITKIVEKCRAAGVKVIILTSTMIGEDQPNPNNQKLIPYNDFLRTLAKEKNCLLADLNADMQAAIEAWPEKKNGKLTGDGVHMNPAGNEMMAKGILETLGLGAAEMEKVSESWLDMPGTCEMGLKVKFSKRQQKKLTAAAAAKKTSLESLLNDAVNREVEELLKK